MEAVDDGAEVVVTVREVEADVTVGILSLVTTEDVRTDEDDGADDDSADDDAELPVVDAGVADSEVDEMLLDELEELEASAGDEDVDSV